MKKKLIVLLIIVIAGIAGYNYIYKDHRNIEKEKAAFTLKSTELSNEFLVSSSDSEKKYLNKTIEISGKVTEVDNNTLIIDNNIFCQFLNPISNSIKTNTVITIKGRFIGYDDLLEEIKLDQCSLSKN